MTDSEPQTLNNNSKITASHNDDILEYLSVDDYDYELPDQLIARYPLAQRSASKLLYLPANNDNKNNGSQVEDKLFSELPEILNAGDLIVFNDTKVMKARLFGQKDTGGKIEVLIERLVTLSDLSSTDLDAITSNYETIDMTTIAEKHIALCHIKASKALKLGQGLVLADGH
ncbi:MAG TPA: S-adenosylmethionine:tRNA ribosyltransferase-isomerase, partial [Psychrobacter sp.]|uniref:S-adenosylmethionine:tRNA ribosyltransferase-isomerase n=1 Tax=Psychrobacter sp. TaxID=56811 RepID=UPI002BBDC615